MKSLAEFKQTDTIYHPSTHSDVLALLEAFRDTKKKVLITYGDTTTGKASLETFNTIGRVGRSNGAVKVLILINGGNGGYIIDTEKILRIVRYHDKSTLYQHDKYEQGVIMIRPQVDNGDSIELLHDNKLLYKFKNGNQARLFCAKHNWQIDQDFVND